MKSYNDILSDVTKTAIKIPQSDYLEDGKYRIFDQGKEYSVGFSNDEQGVVTDYPYIIFGDHTRVVKYVNEPCFIGADGVKLLKVINKDFNPRYVYYNILAKPIESQGYARHFKFLKEIQFTEKSFSEQQKIATELDTIQSAIDNKKQQLSLLDEAVKSEFVEMFDSIIEKSEKIDLEKICTFVTVGIANSATHAFCDDGIIMFRNQNIKEDFLDDSDVIYIKQDFAEKYKSKALKENDLLIVRTGYPGVCCLVPKKYEGCQTFTTLIARLKENSNINPKFICHYINSKYGREYVEKNQAGVAQQNFGATALSKMPMVIPPINLQNQFAAFVQQIDKSKFVLQQQLQFIKKYVIMTCWRKICFYTMVAM